jgi:uncharacterized protein with HEPN domain
MRRKNSCIRRNIEIIGETARNIECTSPDFVARHVEVPWSALYTMRNPAARLFCGRSGNRLENRATRFARVASND